MAAAHFKHDCDDCRFLGHADSVDHYHCSRGDELVMRRGDGDCWTDELSAIGLDDLRRLAQGAQGTRKMRDDRARWNLTLILLSGHLARTASWSEVQAVVELVTDGAACKTTAAVV